jgi:hypothetical protein
MGFGPSLPGSDLIMILPLGIYGFDVILEVDVTSSRKEKDMEKLDSTGHQHIHHILLAKA